MDCVLGIREGSVINRYIRINTKEESTGESVPNINSTKLSWALSLIVNIQDKIRDFEKEFIRARGEWAIATGRTPPRLDPASRGGHRYLHSRRNRSNRRNTRRRR